jgi:acetyltransferase-like isoleucine patch superfamily enzyme
MSAAHRRSQTASAADARAAVAPPAAPPRAPGWRDRVRVWRAGRRGVVVADARSVVLGRGVRFDLAPGARVTLGPGVALGDGCRIHAGAGAVVALGRETTLGERCAIAAHERVTIGAGCLLADEVVIADFDQRFDDVERPVREQGLTTTPVHVCDGARVGPGVAILSGITVGADAAVGAHAVVTADVAPGDTVLGVPAAAPRPARPRR